jgi:polyphosphate glucokinase
MTTAESTIPVTLTVDVGGQGIKGRTFRLPQEPISDRIRIKTPRPAEPRAVLDAIVNLADRLRPFDRVSVGFPGVVKNGVTHTAPNLDGPWHAVPIQAQLAERLAVPVRTINDADMQGYGAISGHGSEMMVTFGTGMGAALFIEGRLLPNLELGHHPFEKGQTYEQRLGQAALDATGKARWNKRLLRAIDLMQRIFNFDTLYVGGGNARCIKAQLPAHVIVVKNEIALIGGVKLWNAPAAGL